jgi:ubiquinone/menaquinone biosynthesis C-methylase UbiE
MSLYQTIAEMYNKHAEEWNRDDPVFESDEIVRPIMLNIAKSLNPTRILDLGCGEGYFTWKLAKETEAQISGIDLSERLIRIGQEKEAQNSLGIDYHIGNMLDLSKFEDEGFDLATAAFSFHYLHPDDNQRFYEEVSRIIKSRGHFVIGTVNPRTRWQMENALYPEQTTTYEQDEGKVFKNKLTRRDGQITEVWYVHKTLERIESDIAIAGFNIKRKETPRQMNFGPYSDTIQSNESIYLVYLLEKR